MNVISDREFEAFYTKHSDARDSLDGWRAKTDCAVWSKWADVKLTFNDADMARDRVVFNISNNKYRLIADIEYEDQNVTVERLMTHEQYRIWNNRRRGKGPGRS